MTVQATTSTTARVVNIVATELCATCSACALATPLLPAQRARYELHPACKAFCFTTQLSWGLKRPA